MALGLDSSVQYIKGVGPKLGDLLAKRGIKNLEDLLETYPRAFEDRRAARNIASLQYGDLVSLKAQINRVNQIPLGGPRSGRRMYEVIIADNSGKISCRFFRVPYKGYFERLVIGKMVRVVGRVQEYRGRKLFNHPELLDCEPENEVQDEIYPIYSEIEGFPSQKLAKIVKTGLGEIKSWPVEILPNWILEQYKLVTRQKALIEIHQPSLQEASAFLQFRSQAHRRLIFEEFFWLELLLASRHQKNEKEKVLPILNAKKLIQNFKQSLPFTLTNSQLESFAEIEKDLASGHPMNRLLQGDVGCGKTMLAWLSCLYVIESGKQAALMVPTEILAEQHFKNAQNYLKNLNVNLGFLSGKTKASERKQVIQDLRDGKIQLLIGTHALIEPDVIFKDLALVIIDEQHRFGVEQRSELKSKGKNPHLLVMTATPIPRTLAMTVYGDLDVSQIRELPSGRSPIQTRVIYESKRSQALKFMYDHIKLGRQAYLVYPLVEESEKLDLKNATDEFEKLKHQFPDIKMQLLHGRLKAEEKEAVMDSFRLGKTQLLVSTTVIEVGVDVPNANIMIVEQAERFGLSQLHQLRGRVGRGAHKSFCILINGYAVSDDSRKRTEFMERTQDGFKIAEFDLELRGPGEFLGTRQSGLPGFKLAHLVRDTDILEQARDAAFKLIKQDPELKLSINQEIKKRLDDFANVRA